ncbi:hypothetical protein [Pseudomonas viridiflava]|uniref:hypothetical protein n=1 Tax=Pseudomonas viridiflava TaxID=33069 RepID=UPI000F024EA8|nr:hypothetical protein [Pseudomonas viridiflava]
MPSFALISEGITDQVVIEAVLHAVYKGSSSDDGLSVTHLQPTRDATDYSRQDKNDFGGWQQVLEHCSLSEHLYEAIALNDFVIIHIDSDICWHDSINIDPNQISMELISSIELLILSKIDGSFLKMHRDKIILAVAIHSTECWVIPFYSSVEADRNKINSCEAKLAEILAKNKIIFKKDYNCFMSLAKPLRKKKHLEDAMACSPSLSHFVSALPIPAPPPDH